MSVYSFDTNHAKEYGVNEAIVISNFQFWIKKNKANNRHKYSKRHWTFNSVDAFKELFEFWSAAQIRRILDSLIDQEVLCRDRFNKAGYDKTMWYAFINESEFIEGGFLTNHTQKAENPHKTSCDEISKSICQKQQMEVTKLANGSDEISKPIPDSKPDENTDSKHIKEYELFEFWKMTMNKTGNTKFTSDRKRLLTARLKNYSVDEIKKAIVNCSLNKFLMDGGHNDLTLICRTDSKLEGYRDSKPKNNKQSKHSGFAEKDYSEDATPDNKLPEWLKETA